MEEVNIESHNMGPTFYRLTSLSFHVNRPSHSKDKTPWEKNWPPWLLTVTKMVTASRDWAVTWAMIELWPSRDWAMIILKMPWLSCDLAVTELWPSRDLAVTELWPLLAVTEPWSLGPGAVTTVLTVTIYFLMGLFQNLTLKIKGQGHGWGESWKSQHGSNILSIHIPLIPCQSAIPFLR